MKTPIITTLLLGLSVPVLVLAAESNSCLPEHAAMGHCQMETSPKQEKPAKAKVKPATKPTKQEKPAKAKVKPAAKPQPVAKPVTAAPKVSTCTPEHEAMGHCKSSDTPTIPVSDGSATADIPMPFHGAMEMEDDPILTKVMINQLETRKADQGDNPLAWDAEAWIGKDLNKLWLKTEGESIGGNTEEAEVQALYSRAIAPFWDVQAGVRKDFKPEEREWATVGVKGLAPYQFDVDAALFAGTEGRTAARLKGEYEIMLTRKTVLSPEAELNLYGKDDPEMGIGPGLADANVGLRLRHEFKREFAPYIGINWSKKFGKTANYARENGNETQDTQFVAGVRLWF